MDNKKSEKDSGGEASISRSRFGEFRGWVVFVGIVLVVAGALLYIQYSDGSHNDSVSVDDIAYDELDFRDSGIYNVSAPISVSPNGFLTVSWVVSAAEATSIPETAVYWGDKSAEGVEFGLDTAPDGQYSNYSDDFLGGGIEIPRRFESTIVAPDNGVVFYRVHAEIDGEHYWSPEFSAVVDGK